MQLRKPLPMSSYKADSDPSNSGMSMSSIPQTTSHPESNAWNTPIQQFSQQRSATNHEVQSKPSLSYNPSSSQSEPQQPINRSSYIYNNPPHQNKIAPPQPPPINKQFKDIEDIIRNPVAKTIIGSMITNEPLPFNIQSYFPGAISILKHYFNVSHRYVLNRLGFLLFPFHTILKTFNYSNSSNSSSDYPLTISKTIIERPETQAQFTLDFYIPLMALITYTLLFGMAKGTSNEFKPDVLGNQATYSITIIAIEAILIKVSFYLAKNSYINTFDTLAFCGYKFVHLALITGLGLVFKSDKKSTTENVHLEEQNNSFIQPYLIYIIIINYFTICYAIEMAFFLSIHSKSHHESNSLTNASNKNRVRLFIGLFFGLLQFPVCWSLMPPSPN